MTPSVAFYCVADERYFLGAAGLVNSLRVLGHDDPVFVLDCGLSRHQRELLAPHATLVEAPSDRPPWLLKTVVPLSHPADVIVILDTDMVLTRSLTPLIERAAAGSVVAFQDRIDRFVPEWGELLGIGAVRRGPYVCSGALCMGRSSGTELLRSLDEHQQVVDFDLTYWRRNVVDYPFRFGDQDVLNAILATGVLGDRLVVVDRRLAPTPPFSGLRVVDAASLRCAYADGVEPFLLHHYLVKPWLEATHHGVYSRLLRRLLVGGDVAVTVPQRDIPLRWRTGLLAYAERTRVNTREFIRYHVRDPLASRLAGGRR